VDGSGTSINDRCLRPPGAGVVRLIHTFLAFPWGRHGSDRSCRELCRDSTSPPNQLDTEWVGLFRETQADGRVRYGVEHLDQRFDEICPDDLFSTETEAEARAQAEYALRPEDWRDGQALDPDWNKRAGAASRLEP
jgi:hypothetical protein